MIFYETLPRHIHLEPTRECNARCPQCSRTDGCTLNTVPGLEIDEVGALELKDLLSRKEFLDVTSVLVNGNYGDIVMHTHPREFFEVLLEKIPHIQLHTNGGALSTEFWSWLGTTRVEVEFGIDGLEDTHHLYRRKTRFDIVWKNAVAFIEAGGHAVCAMNVFRHNEHQKEELAQRCAEAGFKNIIFRPDERFGNTEGIQCYDKDGNPEYKIYPTTEFVKLHEQDALPIFMNTVSNNEKHAELSKEVQCRVLMRDSIYISGQMKTWPCCWMEKHGILENNSLRKNSFESINQEMYSKIYSKWNTPECLSVCTRKCEATLIEERLTPYESKTLS